MPKLTSPLSRNSTGPSVAELHSELLSLGATIASTELTAKRFGDDTEKAVRAFRLRYGLPDTGTVDESLGLLTRVASIALEGDRAALRAATHESVAASGNAPPQVNYWLARYAIMAGDYATAQAAADRAPQLSGLVHQITEAVLDSLTVPPRPPEVPFPENFYTYRYNLLPQERLDELLGRSAPSVPGSSRRIMGISGARRKEEDDWPDPPDEPEDPEPPDSNPVPDPQRRQAIIESADSWLRAADHWQFGNEEFRKQRYASAVSAYTACQEAVLNYFAKYYGATTLAKATLEERVTGLVHHLVSNETQWSYLWESMRQRRLMLSLQELGMHDWGAVTSSAVAVLMVNLGGAEVADSNGARATRQRSLDKPLLILATIFAPQARAEANRLRRQHEAADRDLRRVLRPYVIRIGGGGQPPAFRSVWLTCDFIELPFARLLLAETLLDKADAQYKGRTHVADEDVSALEAAAAEYKTRLGDPGNRNQAAPFQLMQAAKTYLSVVELFQEEGQYVQRVNQGLDALRRELDERLSEGDVTSIRFRAIGKDTTIPTIKPVGNTLPGLDRQVGPHEPLVKFQLPPGQPTMRETNPRVYSVLLEAQARLLQLWSWFNYLGYPDDYVPPWRFLFLLDRARYFAEHAKSAQREYLNFLSNAEREEFQELTAAQNVELEKMNVLIETARVDQVLLEVEAGKESAELANITAQNAHDRLGTYTEFDAYADRLMDTEAADFLVDVITLGGALDAIPGVSTALESIPVIGGLFSSSKRKLLEAAQREVEKYNLALAELEANQAANVANAQLAAAQAGLVVAGLQRQAALLRHEFALQNLHFLRIRTLNAELWYRLSGSIRSVADTYLRYGIEMAFLAEQAYEFEADKRINVIRFDYDVSDLGDMLAGDFLLRDLDTLEQDLIIGQRLRQQQVRYVLSHAREFPEALQELRDNGHMTFSLRLEQLERRFPGLFNVRIASVEVLPVALMDPTRFSLELTHLGSGQVRLKAQPGTSPIGADGVDDWLSGLQAEWPVKVRVAGPETAVFSGLTRQDFAGLPSFYVSNQRGAFEGLAGASAWKVDLSMKENGVVPGTLADLLTTFTLSGYYDPSLRRAIDNAPRKATAATTWFSAHQTFPDAFFQFNRSGRMDWQISPDFFTLQGSLGELRNVAVLLPPSARRPELGRLMCSFPVELEVNTAGDLRVLTEAPRLILTTDGLTLQAQLDNPAGAIVTWDFGDGTGISDGSSLSHTYARPGRYEVTIRIAANGRLFEYRAAVVVSRQHVVLPPLIVLPKLEATRQGRKLKVRPSIEAPPGESLSVTWRIDNRSPDTGSSPPTFTLDLPTAAERTKRYTLRFTAVRQLTGCFYSQQRQVPTVPIALNGLHLATNRTFRPATGAETTADRNPFAKHVFGAESIALVLSPSDRWTLDLPLEGNPGVVGVSSTDVKQYDLSELSDAALALEYEVRHV